MNGLEVAILLEHFAEGGEGLSSSWWEWRKWRGGKHIRLDEQHCCGEVGGTEYVFA